MRKPCLSCGDLSEQSRCAECSTQHDTARLRGREKSPEQKQRDRKKYGSPAWRNLSARARRLQPWCSDCGSRDDLTCEHTAQAWARIEQGKPLRLRDVDVLCRSCNAKRGAPEQVPA